MNFLSVETLTKSFGERSLFENISFGVGQGQKVALVGVNGCGKSTLLKIIAGEDTPDSGVVAFRKGIKVSHLSQNPSFNEDDKIINAIFDSNNETLKLIKEYELCLTKSAYDESAQEKLTELMSQMDDKQAWDYESQIKQILGELGLYDLEQSISQLSGGQRKRVALAKALIEKPDFMIMDEPTNHLDLDSIEWLENYLATAQLSLILVTHDRYFLEKVTNEIIEIDQGGLHVYKGNYSYFLEKKAERQEQEATEISKAKNLMKKELEWMRRQPKARGTKAKYRVDAFGDLKKKASKKIVEQNVELSVKTQRLGGKILEIDKLNKAYDGISFIKDFSYIFKKKDRIGIIGKNGVGKSTFLNTLTGEITPDSGEIEKGVNTVFGYYTQTELQFKEDQRVIDIVKEVAEVIHMADGSTITASSLLTMFNFPPDTQYSVVSKLSGGEKRRLQLLRVLMLNPNFLILDEPTNDLDLITLNTLEDFLFNFSGCLLIVSHDRYFMDRLVDHSFIFEGEGIIKDFPGNYSDYREWKLEEDARKEAEQKELAQRKSEEAKQKTLEKPKEKKKLSFKEQKEYETLEQDIENLEIEKEELLEKMNSGITDHQELAEIAQRIETVDHELDSKTERWIELSEYV
ncbi:ABC-F family ATP-binding cassette domain-containing protein [Aureibacter tunicatorum]|uniref:ATP-binding cassette subfamily F protein uup n=1 Tax=Aureibacter tunicatorum TaxID=866807 RepID=A0AAE3XQS6_9BACT|nr:ABC-F family ATP-binding cassette domain-containing protein [Aureibacter tunicatorum]MDR6240211.1 ATP-binding cassette subfamily F protein uup [Aureibacter tunicatorum]BDD05908.1 ABC transporter ATP-binding protein [Aureibacter tunicatorum]